MKKNMLMFLTLVPVVTGYILNLTLFNSRIGDFVILYPPMFHADILVLSGE